MSTRRFTSSSPPFDAICAHVHLFSCMFAHQQLPQLQASDSKVDTFTVEKKKESILCLLLFYCLQLIKCQLKWLSLYHDLVVPTPAVALRQSSDRACKLKHIEHTLRRGSEALLSVDSPQGVEGGGGVELCDCVNLFLLQTLFLTRFQKSQQRTRQQRR